MSRVAITQHNVTERIREAARLGRVILTEHVRQRMQQRGVTIQQIIRVLTSGKEIEIQQPKGPKHNPVVKLRGKAAGDMITVIASVQKRSGNESAVVVTAWKRNTK